MGIESLDGQLERVAVETMARAWRVWALAFESMDGQAERG
jgi:hypothetical protein